MTEDEDDSADSHWYDAGMLHRDCGEYEKAIAAFERFLAGDSWRKEEARESGLEALWQIPHLLLKLDRKPAALEALSRLSRELDALGGDASAEQFYLAASLYTLCEEYAGGLAALERFFAGCGGEDTDDSRMAEALYLKAFFLDKTGADPLDVVIACKAYLEHRKRRDAPHAPGDPLVALLLLYAGALEALSLGDQAAAVFGAAADLYFEHREPVVEQGAATAFLSLIRLHLKGDRPDDARNALSMMLETVGDSGKHEVLNQVALAAYMFAMFCCSRSDVKIPSGVVRLVDDAALKRAAGDAGAEIAARMIFAAGCAAFLSGDCDRGHYWMDRLLAGGELTGVPDYGVMALMAKLLTIRHPRHGTEAENET